MGRFAAGVPAEFTEAGVVTGRILANSLADRFLM